MPLAVWVVYAFFIGLLFGSFANVVIWRLPRGKSIHYPPSACVACGRRLLAFDLVPVASWLFLRGRCRYCGVKVSARYPVVELLCGVLFACMIFFAANLSGIILCFLAFLLLCVSMIDIDKHRIPYGLWVAGMVVGVAWVGTAHFSPEMFPLAPTWYEAFAGAVLGLIALPLKMLDTLLTATRLKNINSPYTMRERNAIEMVEYSISASTVQITAMAGIFLGWQLMLVALVLALIISGIAGIRERRYRFFLPAFCVSVLIALWFGPMILRLYGIG